jgi:hypothetical protein
MKTRVSINLHQKAFEMMDCRVTPGNDVRGSCSDERLEIRHIIHDAPLALSVGEQDRRGS